MKHLIIITLNLIFISFTVYGESDPVINSFEYSWVNMSGFSQNELNQKYYVISGIESDNFEAGVNYFDSRLFFYSNVNAKYHDLEFQAGHLKKINYNPLILNNGSYNGLYFSYPEERPLGASITAGQKKYSFQYSQYYFPISTQNDYEYENYPLRIINFNGEYSFNNFSIISQVGFSNYSNEISNLVELQNIFFELNFLILDRINIDLLLYYEKIYFINLYYKSDNLALKMSLFEVEDSVYPYPDFYQEVNNYFVDIWSAWFKVKIYHKKDNLNIKGNIDYSNFGFYQYLDGEKNLEGFYYKDNNKNLSPYLSFYTNSEFNVLMTSLGIRMGTNWMFALIVSSNNSGQSLPLDSQAIPPEIYQEGLNRDSFLTFSYSYTGIQGFFSGRNFFIYAILLQNYRDYSGESLVFLLRLSYQVNF